jgi:pimeloyl-ACP methyl ester carboxylesterase
MHHPGLKTGLLNLPHGISLSCRMAGEEGRPVLMFLHGFPEAAFVWDELLLHFSRPENGAYYCIAPNLRGFEQSSAPPEVDAYRPKQLVRDIGALITLVCGDKRGGQLECLIAHDWGGAVAWSLAATQPQLMKKLAIINSPHPGTFLRELQQSPAQQVASAYMNFLIRPDAESLLAEEDFRRLWQFLKNTGAPPTTGASPAWLTENVKNQYRTVWAAGLTGGCNLYRASPLRPPRPGPPHHDPAAAAVTIPREFLTVVLPTLVVWALDDIALPPALLDGLADYVPYMQLKRVSGASHWIVHEQPELLISYLQDFLAPTNSHPDPVQ